MNVLITGANGFVGKNLTQRLYTIRDRRDRTRPALQIDEIFSAHGRPRRRNCRNSAGAPISWCIWRA